MGKLHRVLEISQLSRQRHSTTLPLMVQELALPSHALNDMDHEAASRQYLEIRDITSTRNTVGCPLRHAFPVPRSELSGRYPTSQASLEEPHA